MGWFKVGPIIFYQIFSVVPHVTLVDPLTILELGARKVNFQSYFGSTISKKEADPRFVHFFSVSWWVFMTGNIISNNW